jgi:UDP-2,3-diacylglucosamine hydrolase
MHIFIADIHMQPHIREDRLAFLAWLASVRPRAEKIYILGDLFEYWFSGLETVVEDIIAALDDPDIHLMPGNRDFLLKNARIFPGIIREEEARLSLYGKRILITHGHLLTKGDFGFKSIHALGWPLIRYLDVHLNRAWKLRLAEYLVRSSVAIRHLHGEIPRDIAQKKGVDTVICGHLHKAVMSTGLIIVPAYADHAAWLAIDKRGPRFCTRS